MKPIKSTSHRGYTINVWPEEDPISPREDSVFGHMVCWNSRYALGDKHCYRTPAEFNADPERKNDVVILPLYLYDHSGITISTGPFSCPWDSGQVGYIYINKKNVLNELGGQRITSKLRAKARTILEAEVEAYDRYLRGDYVRTSITGPDSELVGGCGDYDDMDYAISEAKAEIDSIIKLKKDELAKAELSIQAS